MARPPDVPTHCRARQRRAVALGLTALLGLLVASPVGGTAPFLSTSAGPEAI